jgi:hypothetical protein
MRIVRIDPAPFHSFSYRGTTGEGRPTTLTLPIFRGQATGLPAKLDAMLVASDLQGMENTDAPGGVARLLGEVLAEEVASLAERGVICPRSRIGVLLGGNIFSAPAADMRNGNASGDVRAVWRAFSMRFRWVAGVWSNYDTLGATHHERQAFDEVPDIFVLDGKSATIDGLKVGGVGGIIGDTSKPGRREERDFLRLMRSVLAEKPNVLVLHHGPDADRGRLRGNAEIRRMLDRSGPLLVVCGHFPWSVPLTDIRGGAQVVNTNGRVLILERAPEDKPAEPRKTT